MSDRVRLELQFLGERGEAWHLAAPHAAAFVGKSLVVADPGAFDEARRRRARGEQPVVVVSLPRWKAEAEQFIAASDERQGELL